jgi:hypothetical protein
VRIVLDDALRVNILVCMKRTTTAQVFGKAVRGVVVCIPGDEERGVDGAWHIVGAGGQRHPLDSKTFATKREAVDALKTFEG